MAYLGQGSLLGSVRLQQQIQSRTPKTTVQKFGTYKLPSIITTSEPIDLNPNSFAHRHRPSAIDYSDPLTRPPQWRKQVMLPYPPPPGFIERKNYGMSRIDLQNVRRLRRDLARAEAAEKRSQLFRQQQEVQRLENKREAVASRAAKLSYAINKLKMGIPLTVEDQSVIAEDDRIREMIEHEKKLAGPAGAELEAAIAKATAGEATYNKESYDPAYNNVALKGGAHNLGPPTSSVPPSRQHIVEYDPDEPPSQFRTHLPPNHPRRQIRSKPGPPMFLQIFQLLMTLPIIIFMLGYHNFRCPDGFRFCPCGIIKRPYRFLAENPGLVFGPVVMLIYVFWDDILYQLAQVLLSMFYIGVSIIALLIPLPSRH